MAGELVRFGEFELDRAAYQLRRKGRVVRLQRIPLDLLLFLVERRGQLVTREEIRNRIWGADVFVDTESSINTAMRKLRRMLRDRPGSPRFIETVPAKGYRFIAVAQEPASQAILIRQPEVAFTDHESKTIAVSGSQTGERRHLTVLVCDLMNSTSLAVQPDPEEWWESAADYHRLAVQAIDRYGGHVGPNRGDAMMAYFGWPEAHENDAERAVRAGLEIIETIAKFNQQSSRPKLSGRVGIDSGMVVVGGVGKDADVFGHVPNIAAQVQAATELDSLLITAATHALVSGLFVVEKSNARQLKRVPSAIELFRVVRSTGVRGLRAARRLTPFVGREEELRLLMNRWESAVAGEGQLVLMIGEPGIGKSRLVQRFREQIAGYPHTWLESGAVPFFQNTPFYAVTDMLQQGFHWESQDSAERKLAALEASLAVAGVKLDEAVPLVAQLLELPVDGKYTASSLSPEQQRKRLLSVLVAWVFGAAKAQPLIIATEDLHWADASTLELIQLLVEQGASARLLLLYTARPEFHAPWPLRAHHTQITLNRLNARNVREMIAHVTARNALTADAVNAVIERTSGVPLFVEELTQALLERGNAKLSGRDIPVTLRDSLMARLDRLGAAKEILQIGAVIGSEFSYELLQAVHPIDQENLQRTLRLLADTELLYVRGIAPDATYQFKHALIRDAAYEALLKGRRKDLHRLIAQTISEKFEALEAAQPEVLARHWSEAGETEQAIVEWSRASNAARERYAFIEAQESLQQALSLLNLLPESHERDVRELRLRNSLSLMLKVTRGWGAPETVETEARISGLAEKSGRLAESTFSRCFHAYIAGDLSTAVVLGERILELAPPENLTFMAYTRMMLVNVHHKIGDLVGSEKHFAAGLKFFDDPAFRDNPNGGAISVFGGASWNAWTLGRADIARERAAEIRAALNPANTHDLPWADFHEAFLLALMRENQSVEALAARALDLCEKYRFPNEAAFSRCLLGHARARLGRPRDGIALIRHGIDALVQVGNRIVVPDCLTYLAAAQLGADKIADALGTIEQALDFNPEEVVGRPEALRIRGELRLKDRGLELAEADFRDSISMARSMGAKAWELRTAMSLARLLASKGKRAESHAMLAEIYGWFTEGFDTADLKEAKTLLEELAK